MSRRGCRGRWSAGAEQSIDAAGEVRQVRRVTGRHFRGDVSAVADLHKRPAHRLPVDVPFAQVLPCEPAARPVQLEILQVHLHDPLAKRPDPILRVSVKDHVADVEVGAHPWGFEFIDVARELERAEEKLVPHLLDRDDDLELRRERKQALADYALRSRPGVAIGRRGIDNGGTSRTASAPHRDAFRREVSIPRTLRLTTSASPLERGNCQWSPFMTEWMRSPLLRDASAISSISAVERSSAFRPLQTRPGAPSRSAPRRRGPAGAWK